MTKGITTDKFEEDGKRFEKTKTRRLRNTGIKTSFVVKSTEKWREKTKVAKGNTTINDTIKEYNTTINEKKKTDNARQFVCQANAKLAHEQQRLILTIPPKSHGMQIP